MILLLTLWIFYPTDIDFIELESVRQVSTGYGPIIDDLESMTQGGHDMRNTWDPGNWAHELTHLINARVQGMAAKKYGRAANGFYLLHGLAVIFPEPKVTIKQVAGEVPKNERGPDYRSYLIESQGSWNEQPLYLLNEAVSSGVGLYYHVDSKTIDKHREDLDDQWISYSSALIRTIEKFDPEYPDLGRLNKFVKWHNSRLNYLRREHQKLITPFVIYDEE